MTYQIENKVKAYFKLEIRKANGELKETGWFPNLVLNQGLERLGYGGVLDYCRVGTGSSTPDPTQTALDSQVAWTRLLQGQDSWGNNTAQGYNYIRRKFRFDTGVAAGNLTEVGVGWGTDVGSLFNRAMIRDTSGNITTVTVLPDEVLDVLVELRCYCSIVPVTGTATISGVTYQTKITPLLTPSQYTFMTEYFCWTSYGYNSSWGGMDQFVVTNQPYLAGSLKRRFDIYWGLNYGNSAPLKYVNINSYYASYSIEFTPTIPKTSESVLKLSFEFSWGRYE